LCPLARGAPGAEQALLRSRAPRRRDDAAQRRAFGRAAQAARSEGRWRPRAHRHLIMAEATVSDEQLRLFIERIERLEEEKRGIADDVRDTYSEAKSQGYDAKIMRQIVRLRKMEPHDRQEMEAILDVYKSALGLA